MHPFIFAAFLRNPDGTFDYASLLGSLAFAFLAYGGISLLCKAIKTGRILFGGGGAYSSTYRRYFYRDKNPMAFWFVFVLYCVKIPVIALCIIAFCFGWFHNPNQ